ncbi:type II toxin-antitoxin system death-on-curing family toxin [Nocardia asteroides]|uniref:type II toxin-antitoxin system death-on-curing family toxin n=1 Tax=Nocardia asteroides TaxID=1824 RepID=UPI00343C5A8B
MTTFAIPVAMVIGTNRKLTAEQHALLDRGKLEGALARPMHTWDGQLLFPTVLERGAALLHGLPAAHAFQDGNKRTAWLTCNMYLNTFDSPLQPIDPLEIADYVEAMVSERYEVEQVAIWLSDRLK